MSDHLVYADVRDGLYSQRRALAHQVDSLVELRGKVMAFADSSSFAGATGTAMRGYWRRVHGGVLDAFQECIAKYLSVLTMLNDQLNQIDPSNGALANLAHLENLATEMNAIERCLVALDRRLPNAVLRARAALANVPVGGPVCEAPSLFGAPAWSPLAPFDPGSRRPEVDFVQVTRPAVAEAIKEIEGTIPQFSDLRRKVLHDSNALPEVNRLLDEIERVCRTATMVCPRGTVQFSDQGFNMQAAALRLSEDGVEAMLERLLSGSPEAQAEAIGLMMARGLEGLSPSELVVLASWVVDESVTFDLLAMAIEEARLVFPMASPDSFPQGTRFNSYQETLLFLEFVVGGGFMLDARNWQQLGLNPSGRYLTLDELRLTNELGKFQLLWAINQNPGASPIVTDGFHRNVPLYPGDDPLGRETFRQQIPAILVVGDRTFHFTCLHVFTRGGNLGPVILGGNVSDLAAVVADLEAMGPWGAFWDSFLGGVPGLGADAGFDVILGVFPGKAWVPHAVNAGREALNATQDGLNHGSRLDEARTALDNANRVVAAEHSGLGVVGAWDPATGTFHIITEDTGSTNFQNGLNNTRNPQPRPTDNEPVAGFPDLTEEEALAAIGRVHRDQDAASREDQRIYNLFQAGQIHGQGSNDAQQ